MNRREGESFIDYIVRKDEIVIFLPNFDNEIYINKKLTLIKWLNFDDKALNLTHLNFIKMNEKLRTNFLKLLKAKKFFFFQFKNLSNDEFLLIPKTFSQGINYLTEILISENVNPNEVSTIFIPNLINKPISELYKNENYVLIIDYDKTYYLMNREYLNKSKKKFTIPETEHELYFFDFLDLENSKTNPTKNKIPLIQFFPEKIHNHKPLIFSIKEVMKFYDTNFKIFQIIKNKNIFIKLANDNYFLTQVDPLNDYELDQIK